MHVKLYTPFLTTLLFRIVVAGNISYHVVEGSANAFHFDQEYGMSAEEAAAVSNHYPVEVTLDLEGTYFT